MSTRKVKVLSAGVFVGCALIARRVAWATPGVGLTITNKEFERLRHGSTELGLMAPPEKGLVHRYGCQKLVANSAAETPIRLIWKTLLPFRAGSKGS